MPPERIHARALCTSVLPYGTIPSPNVCIRAIILGEQVVDGHLDTCATHCFVSSRMSRQLTSQGRPPIDIKPFPVGQGNPLPDATQAHVAPLYMMTPSNKVVGLDAVLFLVSNTGADILIANNILEHLGILRYQPQIGYEAILNLHVQKNKPLNRSNQNTHKTKDVDRMIRQGICMMTISAEATLPSLDVVPVLESDNPIFKTDKHVRFQEHLPSCRPPSLPLIGNICHHCGIHHERCRCKTDGVISFQFGKSGADISNEDDHLASKQKEPGILLTGTDMILKREIRKQKIAQAAALQVGSEPPKETEIQEALRLLKSIAENPDKSICSTEELKSLSEELSKNRPEWAECLTPAHTHTSTEDAKWAKLQIEEMMDTRFSKTVFSKTLELPCAFPPFEIKTKKGMPPERSIQPRRFKDPNIVRLIEEWTDGLLKDGLIRKSETPVAAPVTVVLKKNRDPRVCIDYRERNSRTETPIFPMPDVHDFLDDAAGFNLYASFDCTKMFNQYEIVEEHRHLAAFMTHQGTYEPCRILFGLTGGPQHAVRSARPSMKDHPYTNGTTFTAWALEQNELGENPPYVIDPQTNIVPGSRLDIFIDDCRIATNHPKALVKLCELWFLFCEEKRLILSRKKAKICLPFLPLLGFVVSKYGKHLDPSRISSLLELPRPASKEGLHALLCSFNFVRMFIPNFSVLAAPLYAATRGIIWKGAGSGRSKGTREIDPDFLWTDELDRCLRQLQTAILSAPILQIPNYSIALFLSVDACLKGEGWVLWQIIRTPSGKLVPVAIRYGSTKYTEAESTWEVTRQEAHAIQSALKDCYDYLFFCHFYLLTDHRNLTFLSNSVNRAVIRIRHFMQQFNMTVVHVPGIWNNPADGISRLENKKEELSVVSDLTSATSADSKNNFTKIQKGSEVHHWDDPLQESDRVIYASSKVLLTHGSEFQPCDLNSRCLLCDPNLDMEEHGAKVLLTVETEPFSNTPQNEELFDKEIASDILSEWSDGRVLLTQAEKVKEANDWKLSHPNQPDKVILYTDDEWDTPSGKIDRVLFVSKEGFFPMEKSVLEPSEVQIPNMLLPRDHTTGIVDNITQTTPADFRSVKIMLPFSDDFKAIHNDEVGHHGLAHSYRKLMVLRGSDWVSDQGTASQVKEKLKSFIENCPICQKIRGLQDAVKSKHSFIISRPFLECSYDFIVFEKPDKNGMRYIIVVVDNFTKLVELLPVPDRGAIGVVMFLLQLKARYGPINRLRSDREAAFFSLVLSKFNELAGTTSIPCVAYHPQANSVCERQNQIIMIHLRALVYNTKLGPDSLYSWSDLVPFVYSIVNNTPKMPLAISPLSMVFGVFANYDRPLLEPRPIGTLSNPVDYVEGLLDWQTKLIDIAEGIQSRHYEKLAYNTATKDPRAFQEGDFVLQIKTSTGSRGKLVTRWIGPRLVLSRQNNDASHPVLELLDLVTSKIHEASIDDCRLMKTGWFEEKTVLHDLKKLAALDKEEYEVEKIVDHKPPGTDRLPGSKTSDYWFRVKWAGFSDEENSWEPYSELKNLEPLTEYLLKFPKLKL